MILARKNRKAHNLPSGYQEVEYLESSGEQWIDTGLKVENANIKAELKCYSCQNNYMRGFFGIGGDDSWGFYCASSYYWDNYGDDAGTNMYPPYIGYITVLKDGNKTYITHDDGSWSKTDRTNSYTDTTRNIYLFKKNGPRQPCFINLYSFKIWGDGTTLTLNLIPCYRKLDNKPGLYDLVNDTFYTNQGTGADFIVGNDVKDIEYMVLGRNKPRLPVGYTELEYIESTGTQYIDSGVNGQTEFDFEIQFQLTDLTSTFQGILGNNNWGSSRNMLVKDQNNFVFYPSQTIILGVADTNKHTVKANQNGTYYDDVLKSTYHFSSQNQNIKLFTSSTYKMSGKIFYCKLKQNGTNYNFIPAKRNSDNAIGMYDTVSNTFFENQGTGDFVAGPVVNTAQYLSFNRKKSILPIEYQEVEYLQSDGNQYIDIGIGSLLSDEIEIKLAPLIDTADLLYFGSYKPNEVLSLGKYNSYFRPNIQNPLTLDIQFNVDVFYTWNRKEDGYWYYDNIQKGNISNTTTLNSFLFGRNYSGEKNGLSKMRLAYYTQKRNNEYIRNMIPCYRKSDNKPGLYDTVNNQFYTNANTAATTDFTVGNAVYHIQ